MRIGKWKITARDLVWFIICLVLLNCFGIGMVVCNQADAFDVLSGTLMAVSIVLSLVAVFYTMIEGANNAQVSQDAINKLADIDARLEETAEKLAELKCLDRKLRGMAPKVERVIRELESSKEGDNAMVNDKLREDLQCLLMYVGQDTND